MNKKDFLSELGRMLSGMSETDRNEILYDYEEHFRMGMEEGKTEEEITKTLGDVRTIARQYRADSAIKRAETHTSTGNVFRAVFAIGLLGFFNLVFVFGPFMGLVGVLIGLFSAAVGITVSGMVITVAVIISPLIPSYVNLGTNLILAISVSIGVTCLGLLFFIADCYIAKFFYMVTVKYLKWNMEFVKK